MHREQNKTQSTDCNRSYTPEETQGDKGTMAESHT